MKKHFLLVACVIAALTASSQSLRLIPFAGIGDGSYKANDIITTSKTVLPYCEAGVGLQYKLRKHFILTTGLEWARLAYKMGPFFYQTNFDPLTGTSTGEVIPFDLKYTFNYLRLPLKIGYEYTFGSKLSLNVSAGPSINYLMSAKSSNTLTSNVTDHSQGYQKLNVGFNADVAVTYHFNKRLGILMAPVYSYTSNRINNNGHEHFSIFGARLAAVINLK